MDKINVKFTNCYGIKNLEYTFTTTYGKTFLIYAPNGSMKTSFAQVFKDVSEAKKPSDRIFPQRQTEYSITDENGIDIPKERIYVVEPFNQQFISTRTATLLVNNELRDSYENLVNLIDDSVDTILSSLSNTSKKKNRNTTQAEILHAFNNIGQNLYQILEYIAIKITNDKNPGLGNIAYNEVINDKVLNFLSSETIRQQLKEYLDRYSELIAQSTYFRQGIFDHTNAEDISKSLQNNGFFAANHAVLLNGQNQQQTTISSQVEFNKAIEEEKQHILNDPQLAEKFKSIDDAITKNIELKRFRRYLQENPILLTEFTDLDELKRKLWISYSFSAIIEFNKYFEIYNSSRQEILKIFEIAKQEETEWKNVVSIFLNRFSVPFSLEVINQEEVILNNATPSLIFKYTEGEDTREIGRDELINYLSVGENRALYLLNVIFDIQSLFKEPEDKVLILDDVADSFDYKNKYAIIEYINSIDETNKFIVFILTHNFDFYRTVQSRLNINRTNNCLIASKSIDTITLEKAEYLNPFIYWKSILRTNKIICAKLNCEKQICETRNCNQEILITVIPMVRNLIEIISGIDSDDYLLLTALLHRKTSSDSITLNTLIKIVNKIIGSDIPEGTNVSVVELIYNQANLCITDDEFINLENKIILSIAIRLLAEEIMIKKIDDQEFLENISSNQTQKLNKKFKEKFPEDTTMISLLDKVVLMTPEIIHLNSFMYEPIIDLSDRHLKNLYAELNKLSTFSG